MKNYFDKSLHDFSLSEKGKKTMLIITILSILVFIASSFAAFEFLCITCNLIGAVISDSPYEMAHELSRMFPVLVSLAAVIYLGLFLHIITRSHSKEERRKKLFKNSIAFIVLGSVAFLYFMIGFITKVYVSLVEAYPTWLFPLDTILLDIFFIGLGVFGLLKKDFLLSYLDELPLRVNDNRLRVTKCFDNFFGSMAYFFSLFSFSNIIHAFYVIDWAHGHTFYILTLLLLFLGSILMIANFKFMYLSLKQEEQEEYQFKASIATLVINIVIFVLYAVAISLDPAGPADACYGILPVEFSASANATTYLFLILYIAAPVTALVKYFIHKKKTVS